MTHDKSARGAKKSREVRAYPVALEVRAGSSGGSATIEGYASVTESPYDMWDYYGDYTEVVRTGAFTRTLNADPQVQLLLNHGGLAMAYTKAGTLRLSEDETGLHMAADLNTNRSDIRDLMAALDDGAVDEMSFAFRVTQQLWSPDYLQRDITEVDIHRGDVSVVNFGANPETSVAMRSAELSKLLEGMDDAALRSVASRALAPALGRMPAKRVAGLAAELRAGDPLSTDDATFLAQMLGMASAIDSIVDEMQEAIAEQIGVPNPDDDEGADPAEALTAVAPLTIRHPLSLYLADAERLRT